LRKSWSRDRRRWTRQTRQSATTCSSFSKNGRSRNRTYRDNLCRLAKEQMKSKRNARTPRRKWRYCVQRSNKTDSTSSGWGCSWRWQA
jgi:hypothetical protein